MDRSQTIIRTSIIGIAANVLLTAFKAVVGLISGSIAVVLDAVNNLSDALSSLITIIGTRLAGKEPDRKHPLGYGRIEYLSTLIIAVIILYAGITSLIESVKKIISPETADYSAVSLVIIAAAVVVKLLLGRYVKHKGEQVNSGSLIASGSDALFDAIISSSTLVAALIFLGTGVSLEAWLGAVISLVIIKSGLEMLRDTISDILGERADAELSQAVRRSALSFPEVKGVYDMVFHSYGPDRTIGSLHVELPKEMTIREADTLERAITQKVALDTGVILTGISVYSSSGEDTESYAVRSRIAKILNDYPQVLQMHGFFLDEETKTVRFDLVVGFEGGDRKAVFEEIIAKVKKELPDYTIQAFLDLDTAD